jgi:outer membrane protein assembly factor BamE (lipoprotein component of BamABCDE complex)
MLIYRMAHLEKIHFKNAVAICGFITICCFSSVSAAQVGDSLTHGAVQMSVKVGETTQDQVLETFGAPNITSIDGTGQEVWVYERHSTVSSSTSQGVYGTLGIVGGAKSKNQEQISTRQTTLIIKFDARKIVSDFKSRSSAF